MRSLGLVLLALLLMGFGGWMLVRKEQSPSRADSTVAITPDPFEDVLRRLKDPGGKELLPEVNSKETITRVLDAKVDAPTHLGFALAADGSLREAPTLRTLLLDRLTKVDPAAAAAYAEKILATKESADEWAVALRACAIGNGSSEGLLKQKMREMITHEPWRRNPSTGFLEAFDVIVYTRDTELTPTLAELVRDKSDRAVAHAAYLALDRLIQTEPNVVLSQLLAQPELMTGREATRANFFARADPADPRQRAILEAYLLSPALAAGELETFSGMYPNANFMVSQNLLTPSPSIEQATLARRDAQALRVVREWLADSRFAKRQRQLEKIQQRLETFVQQAKN